MKSAKILGSVALVLFVLGVISWLVLLCMKVSFVVMLVNSILLGAMYILFSATYNAYLVYSVKSITVYEYIKVVCNFILDSAIMENIGNLVRNIVLLFVVLLFLAIFAAILNCGGCHTG